MWTYIFLENANFGQFKNMNPEINVATDILSEIH